MFTMLTTLTEAVSERAQKAAMKEWRNVSAELEIFSAIAKKMSARVKELEDILLPVVKEMDEGKGVIDNAILEYKSRAGKTTVSYSEMYTRAFETATEEQKAALEAFRKSIEKTGDASESLKIVDPKLQKILAGVKSDMTVDELKQKLVEIAKLPDHIHGDQDVQEGSVLDSIKKAIKYVKNCFKGLLDDQEKATKSAKALLKIAKAGPKETMTEEKKVKMGHYLVNVKTNKILSGPFKDQFSKECDGEMQMHCKKGMKMNDMKMRYYDGKDWKQSKE